MDTPLIETLNPEIDVESLMQRLRQRVAAADQPHPLMPGDAVALRNGVFISSLEAFVNIADQKTQVRTQWPSHLRGAVFGHPKFRGVLLRLLAFFFKDQRHVNEALIAAFRETISLNRQLIEQLEVLRRDHEALKRTIAENAVGQ